jgi:hypothetical protein
MTLFHIIGILLKHDRSLAWRTNSTEEKHTPLHRAFENGNLEVALWIMHTVQ